MVETVAVVYSLVKWHHVRPVVMPVPDNIWLQKEWLYSVYYTNYLPVTDNVLEYGKTIADSAGIGQHGGRRLGDKISSFL